MFKCHEYLRVPCGLTRPLRMLVLICLSQISVPFHIAHAGWMGQQSESQHFKFKWDGSGRTMKAGALYVSFSRYRSEDGVLVERRVETYGSNQAAVVELDKLTKAASHIVQEDVRGVPGRGAIGKRAVLTFDAGGNVKQKALIAWTDGHTLCLIRSTSLAHALDFEQQLFRPTPTNSPSPKP